MSDYYLMFVLEVNSAEMPKFKHEQNDLYDILTLSNMCRFSLAKQKAIIQTNQIGCHN